MSTGATGRGRFAYGIIFTLMLPLGSHVANARAPLAYTNVRTFTVTTIGGARSFGHHHYRVHYASHFGRHFARGGFHYRHYAGMHRHYAGIHYAGLQCVTFVRAETGVQLRGNAANWWNEAEGQYARGQAPEPGAVLSFRGAGRMRLGHVAVVRDIVNSREIAIDHAHWAGSGILREVSVIDVSPANDWTAVRVALRQGAKYGSVYPTNGFIYDRGQATQILTASAPANAPQARVQTASAVTGSESVAPDDAPVADVRPYRHRRHWHRWVARRRSYAEVAELPVSHALDLTLHSTP